MNIAFISDTPYQIVNCINYCCHLNEDQKVNIDLYLGHQFFGSHELKERLEKEQLFQNIYGFEDRVHKKKIIHYYHRCKDILNSSKFLDRVLLDPVNMKEKEYDQIFLSVPTMFGIALSSLFPKADVIYYDDGLGSYYDNLVERMNRSMQGKLCRLFRIDLTHMEAKALYVNNTTFCKSTMTKDIRPLPSMLHCSEEFLQLLYRVFQYKSNPDYDKYPMIYLSQPNDASNQGMEVQSTKIMELLQSYEKQCIVRPHPRQKNLDTGCLSVDKTRGLWELSCANQITENHILLGTYSTAQFIPKLLYQREPYLIFMYEVERPESSNMNYDAIMQMIQGVKEGYSNPEKIKIPMSLAELKRDIEDILNEKPIIHSVFYALYLLFYLYNIM